MGLDDQQQRQRASRVVIFIVLTTTGFALLLWLSDTFRGPLPPAKLSPIPTLGLSNTLQARVALVNSPYLCTPLDSAAPEETLTCANCDLAPVDKTRGLSILYRPEVVQSELTGGGFVTVATRDALKLLFAAAQTAGLDPSLTSGYRSYLEQAGVYQGWINRELAATGNPETATLNANRYSARAGHSEHQLGTAVDVNCAACAAFDDTDTRNLALWGFFEANAHRFGFAISYPREIESLTGYMYEPWHLRYIGVALATELYNAGYLEPNGTCLSGFLRAKASR